VEGRFYGGEDGFSLGKVKLHIGRARIQDAARSNDVDLERHAPGHPDAGLDPFRQGSKMAVSRRLFAPGVDDRDPGEGEFLARKSHGLEDDAMPVLYIQRQCFEFGLLGSLCFGAAHFIPPFISF
jgi:hypothetical protein